MRRILVSIFLVFCMAAPVFAATPRSSQSASRPGEVQSRAAATSASVVSRAATPTATALRAGGARASASSISARAAANTSKNNVVARAATVANDLTSTTNTGAAYEQCKNAYFSCMDQFCAEKDSSFKRCSCSDRIYGFQDQMAVLKEAGTELTVFNENLDTVGLSAAQAAAMRRASEGENALTKDISASKALLQAIMNSIKNEDTNVGGKYSSLNAIKLNDNPNIALGDFLESGQAIAAYNGQGLYSAIYGRCRSLVNDSCNKASLQRAVNAYLMAVEQDCNTVQTAIETGQKTMLASAKESSAMLSLARIENRKKHNSNDMTACLSEIEDAITSEEVCGNEYHKCLDNGKYIDVSTGEPIVGVVEFYKLEKLLSYADGVPIPEQRLSKISTNRNFVDAFVSKVQKFAEPALDKCRENADTVWNDYLDKAMIDIYYAQRAKVQQVRNSCMDFVSSCYMRGSQSLTESMKDLLNDRLAVMPDLIAVNDAICREYIASCDNMFQTENGGGIVEQFVREKSGTDVKDACRAVAQQCFDKFGGTDYVNFYTRNSGLFVDGRALDWFTLYDADRNIVSQCAKQVAGIAACNGKLGGQNILELVFGGFDLAGFDAAGNPQYRTEDIESLRGNRSAGVATEVYNKIIDKLMTNCTNQFGKFVEKAFAAEMGYDKYDICKYTDNVNGAALTKLGLISAELDDNLCPLYYIDVVDTKSWGGCMCPEALDDALLDEDKKPMTSYNGSSQRCLSYEAPTP